jgi:hypothetical protein
MAERMRIYNERNRPAATARAGPVTEDEMPDWAK